MCSGRVDLEFVLKAFLNGQDGVFIGGCRLSECNYITHGNYHALNMVLLCKKIMEHIGLDPARLRIEFMSSADGMLLADRINEFTNNVKRLGPQGQSEETSRVELIKRLEDVINIVPYIKIAKRKKLGARLEDRTRYDTHFTDEEIDRLLNEVPSYYIDPEKCRACMICGKRCPVEAIDGAKNIIHIIDQERCIRCGTCMEACPSKFGAIIKITDGTVPQPVPQNERILNRGKRS